MPSFEFFFSKQSILDITIIKQVFKNDSFQIKVIVDIGISVIKNSAFRKKWAT